MNKNLLIFVIIAVILLAVVYYFSALREGMGIPEDTGEMVPRDDTSVSALEADLTNTHIDNVDQEFADVEMELEAAISEAQ
ncbi:MAG: hypothetical protein G01um101470_903 [Parcubacteria group bacterium Gr01-1014_70]|nr:MAG: hypothetical protein G01um101470_903 [Parcubacteria group bacterium Gr01-1014_70]